VRFQLLLTLGFVHTPESAEARNKLLFTDINDKWVQIAALSSSSETPSLLKEVLAKFRPDVPAYSSLLERLTTMVGIGGTADDIQRLIAVSLLGGTGTQQAKSVAILHGLAQGLETRKSPLKISQKDQQLLVNTFFANTSPELREASLGFLKVNDITDSSFKKASIYKAVAIMDDSAQTYNKRAEAIKFIALGDPAPFAKNLEKLINPREEIPVQLAALQTLSLVKGTTISKYVIQQWPVLSPGIRDAAINSFLEDSMRIALLIDALEKDEIKPEQVGFSNSVQLMMNKDENLRNRARAMFTQNEREAKKVNKEYQQALKLDGDPVKGREVYMSNCGICHQVRGKMGVAIGPDLGTIHNWTKEDIMANVLDPNLSISSGYSLWDVQMKNGESIQGIIASETSAAITLRNNGMLDRMVNRKEVKSLTAINISAMPAGFEKKINQQQMADLLSFLRQN
jgi:putative heme-binding domain-containing protein